MNYKMLITDVFGTTTPMTETKKVGDYASSPKALAEIQKKLKYATQEEVIQAMENGIAAKDSPQGKDHPDFRQYLRIWDIAAELGYGTNDLTMETFSDVESALEGLVNSNVEVRIFSSGSSKATEAAMKGKGLDNLIKAYHSSSDKGIGSKNSKEAYLAIAKIAGINPSEIAYINDLDPESEAAIEAGIGTVFQINREGERCVKNGIHYINDYNQVLEYLRRSATFQTNEETSATHQSSTDETNLGLETAEAAETASAEE
ncbi:MAG: HAD hydrolase-like protein [Candidatus Woesearchaeota archaeon]